MRKLSYLLVATILSACGSNAISEQSGSSSSTGSSLSVTPTASTGFATAASDMADVKPATTFTFSAPEISVWDNDLTVIPFGDTEVSGTFISPTQIELSVDGKTYQLSYNSNTDDFKGRNNGVDASVLLNQLNQYASLSSVAIVSENSFSSRASLYLGIVGYTTDPARLPAQATYSGDASLVAIPEIGGLDTATGTVTMTADFTGEFISGAINLVDATGDTSGPVDLGNMTITFDHPFRSGPIPPSQFTSPSSSASTGGVISGNTFTAALNTPLTDLIDAGIYNDPNLTLNGAFYGPSGEHATGIATGSARAFDATGSQDVLLNLTVNAAKN